jgi:plasmid rolling circle replication initiator protein Rep
MSTLSDFILPEINNKCKAQYTETELIEHLIGTGEILVDKKISGKENPWKPNKQMNQSLFGIMGQAIKIDPTCISPSAYDSMGRCSSWLLFRRYLESGEMRLDKAEFCRHRLCPTCNWRKSLKLFGQMKATSIELMKEFPTARYLFLTLTVKNVKGTELADTLNSMNAGFKLLVNSGKTNASAKNVKANLLGYAKAMEIKYDPEEFITKKMFTDRKEYYIARGLRVGNRNSNFNMYHPHFHILLMVKGEFFTGKGYIKQSQWTNIWRDCMKLDYDPQVNIKVIKPNKAKSAEELTGDLQEQAMTSAISETLKYPIKPDSLKLNEFDTMPENQKEKIVEAVICLSHALRQRRLVTFGGQILKARKKLKQDDVEDGDLIGVDGEPVPESEFELVLFKWMKMGCYVC